MSEVDFSKRRIFVGLCLSLALLGAAVWGFPYARKFFPGPAVVTEPTPQPGATPVDASARAAALAGAQAFYSVDYRAGRQTWQERLCAVSTQTGCTIDQNVLVPALWDQFEQAKTVSTVQVEVQDKVLEQAAAFPGNAPLQVWRLQIQLSAPWPGQMQPITRFPALALVSPENGTWKFERFLTEPEAHALTQKVGRP